MSRSGRTGGQEVRCARRMASPLHLSPNSLDVARFTKSTLTRVAVAVMLILLSQTLSMAASKASTGHFSKQQISSFIKTVTNQMQVGKNWRASFGTDAAGKLYCHSVVLGEGVRAGNYGLYTWFTCSAMHKLDISNATESKISCTGFSSPVWIEPKAGTVQYQPVINHAEYTALRASAPARIRNIMDANYLQLSSNQSRVIVARAIQGRQASSAVSATMCQ